MCCKHLVFIKLRQVTRYSKSVFTKLGEVIIIRIRKLVFTKLVQVIMIRISKLAFTKLGYVVGNSKSLSIKWVKVTKKSLV